MSDKKRKKKIMRSFELREISAVDVPAQEGATAAIIKRAVERRNVIATVEKMSAGMLVDETNGHQHTIMVYDESHLVGETSTNAGHSHPWARSGGSITIGISDGHTHGLAMIATEEKAEKSDEQTPAVVSDSGQNVAEKDQAVYQDQEENDMDIEKALNEAKATASKIQSLSVEHFGFFKALGEDQRGSFLGLDHSGREAMIEVAKKADPIVWTDDETGTEYRKSDGDRMIELARANSTMRKAMRDALAKSEAVELAKRAAPVAGNLPGGESVHCAIVGAIEKIADEKVRGECLAAVKAGNEAIGMAFKRSGTSAPGPIVTGGAAERYSKAVDRIAIEKKLNAKDAEIVLLNTSEGAQLYHEMDQERLSKRAIAQ